MPACETAAVLLSHHGGSEGNVVDERGGQSRDPHHQDDGDGQTLVFGNRLRGEKIRAADYDTYYDNSDVHTPPRQPSASLPLV